MYIRFFLFSFILTLLAQSCKYKEQLKIEDTIWVLIIDSNNSGLKDTIKFKKNNLCEYYSSEIEYNYKGKFSIIKDKIRMNLIADQHSEDGGKIFNLEFDLFIENQKLFSILPKDFNPNKVYLRKL